jgi:hypothetical protein
MYQRPPRDPDAAADRARLRADAASGFVAAAIERGASYRVAHASPPAYLPLADDAHPVRAALLASGKLVPAAIPGIALAPAHRRYVRPGVN